MSSLYEDDRLPDEPKLSQDAAVVLALARTALPFTKTRTDQAERWLRVMRMHGEVGTALQALGVGEGPLEPPSHEPAPFLSRVDEDAPSEPVELVAGRAVELARHSGAEYTGTVHLLFAVLEVYGRAFDHELYRRGTTRDEIFARLPTPASRTSPPR